MRYRKSSILVHGVGVKGDLPSRYLDGKIIPSYSRWQAMLQRCYNPKGSNILSHKDCYVCDEWLHYKNFKDWLDEEKVKLGWNIDKDWLVIGNKVYKPENCTLMPKVLNCFLSFRLNGRNKNLIGSWYHKGTKKFQSSCSDPRTNKLKYIGLYNTSMEAHIAWRNKKLEFLDILWNEGYFENVTNAKKLYENGRIIIESVR